MDGRAMERSKDYRSFWPRYLGEHDKPATRALHYLGTSLGLILLAGGIATGLWWLFPAALVCGYAFAWLSHAAIERNRPATFTHPLWSFISDFRMLFAWLGGGLAADLGADLGSPAARR